MISDKRDFYSRYFLMDWVKSGGDELTEGMEGFMIK